jgi:hypothetical protein
MKGGFDFSSISDTFKNLGSSASESVSGLSGSLTNWWNKDKNQTYTSSFTPTTNYVKGGRRRKNSRKKYGGFSSNTPTDGIASSASSFSGSPTAKAHNYVGGRTKRRRHHKHKTMKHRRH